MDQGLDMNFFDAIQQVWALRALLASSLVGLMCGALGAFIVLRNMSLIGDALSHAILPGVVVAFIVVGYSAIGFFVGAVVAGLFAAVAITWLQQNVTARNDAAIGIVFTAMFSVGVIGISRISKRGGVHLDMKDFLFGNVLGVHDQDLMLTLVIAAIVLISIVLFYRYLFISTFQPVIAETMGVSVKMIHYFLMLMLSLAVVASLQTVGVILVVAMLITPASTALLLTEKLKTVILLSGLLGLIAAIGGLILSIEFNTVPGPAMAVVTTAIYLVAALFAPRKGLIAKALARRGQQDKIEKEDILKESLKLTLADELNKVSLNNRLGMTNRKLNRHLSFLQKQGLLEWNDERISLKEGGKDRAYQLIRAHRLWETYLANQVGLAESQIHEDAENIEHFLTEEMVDEVDKELGYPKVDPHGSPIPKKGNQPDYSLSELEVGQKATIALKQHIDTVAHSLWKRRISPGAEIKVISKDGQKIIVEFVGREESFNTELAARIHVELTDDVPAEQS